MNVDHKRPSLVNRPSNPACRPFCVQGNSNLWQAGFGGFPCPAMNTNNRSEKEQHTPGPWRWLDASQANCKFGEHDLARLVGPLYDVTVNDLNPGRVHEVCSFGNSETYYPTEGTEPSEADKRLIALAPEFFAELKLTPHDAECHPSEGIHSDRCQRVRALIAKAEGGRP